MSELPPERRFRLYVEIAERLKDVPGSEGIREAALEQARQAAKESPEVQKEMRDLLERAAEQGAD